MMKSRFRPLLLIVTVFWIYVALSAMLYASDMQSGLTAMHAGDLFAPWQARLLQYLLLYPLLLGCVWTSLRLGWVPLGRRLWMQALLAVGFAVMAEPALWLGCSARVGMHRALLEFVTANGTGPIELRPALQIWVASATMFLLTYGFGLALATGFDMYRRLRDSQIRSAALERELSVAHLAALRMQLSPHSLFNLLNTIHGQIDGDPADARAMIVQLSQLLRRLLHAGEQEFSRLADELQFARLYLGLQQRRFADRLSVSVPIPELAPQVWVPSLILQPLIENAVVHGLASAITAVEVRVEVRVDETHLILRVTNTICPEEAARADGIGLKNVRERLAIQFGEHASFSSALHAGGLWVAEIRLPRLLEVNGQAVTSVAA